MFVSSPVPEHNPYLGEIRVHLPDKMWLELSDESNWYNVFYKEVTSRIDEAIFSPLYADIGRPNVPIYILVGMQILKEGRNWTDDELFENIRYHFPTLIALGLTLQESKPCNRTYYNFKVRLELHAASTGEDLLKQCFTDLTTQQALCYGVKGKKMRTDGKQFSSNVAKSNRLELVLSVIQKFYGNLTEEQKKQLSVADQVYLSGIASKTPCKHSYGLSKNQKQEFLSALGNLLSRLVGLYGSSEIAIVDYQLVQRLFQEQFKQDKEQVVLKKKTEISGKTLQSAHDLEAKYIKKGKGATQQIDIGFGANLTETIDEQAPVEQAYPPNTAVEESSTEETSLEKSVCPERPKPLRLITDVEVFGADKGEKDCLLDGITNTEKITNQQVEEVSSDGNYHSPENVQAIEQLNEQVNRPQAIQWHVAALQGTPSMFDFEWLEDGQLKVTIIETGFSQIAVTLEKTYRITLENGKYRYIHRANVEATIGHVFCTLNGRKTKYRGLFRNTEFVINRCCWVNYRRIMLYRQRMDSKQAENAIKPAA